MEYQLLSLLKVIYFVPAILSILVLIIVPPIYFIIKQLRPTSAIPIALAISELIYVIYVFITPGFKQGWLCLIQNFFLRFGSSTSTAWCLIYNFDVYISMRQPLLRTNTYHKFFHLAVWLYGLFFFLLFIVGISYDSNSSWEDYNGWDYCQLGGIGILFMFHTVFHMIVLTLLLFILFFSWKRLRKGLPGTRLVRTVTLTRITIFSIMSYVSILFTTLFMIVDQYQKISFNSSNDIRPISNLCANTIIAIQALCVGIFLLTHPVIIDKLTKWRKLYHIFIPSIPRSLDPLNEGMFRRVPEHITLTSDVKMIEDVVRRDVIYQAMIGLTVALKFSKKLNPVPPTKENHQLENTNTSNLDQELDEYNEFINDEPIFSDFTNESNTKSNRKKYYIPIEYDTKIPEIGALISQDFHIIQKFKRIRSPTTSTFKFFQYCPRVFRAIRLKFGISDEDFINSFRPESVILDFIKKNFSEGKSQSFFCYTESGSFIMKTVTKKEKYSLLRALGRFQVHAFENPDTLIKFPLGLYRLVSSGYSFTFIVLYNCMYGQRTIEKRFDLKGSSKSRKSGPNASLGKDTDLKNLLNGGRIQIPKSIFEKINVQLRKDAEMLRDLNIMDYSLLIGFEYLSNKAPNPIHILSDSSWSTKYDGGILTSDRQILIRFGIIDLLQRYDFSKKTEHYAKIIFKCSDGRSISAVNSVNYCSRYISNILNYFEPGEEIPEDFIAPEYSNNIVKSESKGIFSSFTSWLRSGTSELDSNYKLENNKNFLMDTGLDVLQAIHIIDDDVQDNEDGTVAEKRTSKVLYIKPNKENLDQENFDSNEIQPESSSNKDNEILVEFGGDLDDDEDIMDHINEDEIGVKIENSIGNNN